jgi:hypothetical protein
VNVDIGFDIIEDVYRNGTLDGKMRKYGGTVPSYNGVKKMIPYWNTGIDEVPSSDKMTNWSLNFSQGIVKKVFCGGFDESVVRAPLPEYVLFGVLEIDLSYTVVVPVQTPVASLFLEYAGSAQLKAGNDLVKMERLTIQSENPEITESDGYVGYNIDYTIYKIKS